MSQIYDLYKKAGNYFLLLVLLVTVLAGSSRLNAQTDPAGSLAEPIHTVFLPLIAAPPPPRILIAAAQKRGRQVFTNWYKERALEIITERVNHFSAQYGFQPKQVKISSAKTRWGSCSANGTLNFTWRLIMSPLSVIDYVVVHELAHLRVRNHSRKFWQVVESIDPDYKTKRKWLREYGETLYF